MNIQEVLTLAKELGPYGPFVAIVAIVLIAMIKSGVFRVVLKGDEEADALSVIRKRVDRHGEKHIEHDKTHKEHGEDISEMKRDIAIALDRTDHLRRK